jgi:hypothetical protein
MRDNALTGAPTQQQHDCQHPCCRGAEHDWHLLRMQLNVALGIVVQHQVH